MTNAIIELQDVWKIYTMGDIEIPALSGLTLKVNHGEFLAVMGPSGSGKSTALNMIGCLDIPTKGSIYLEGQNISKLSESDLAQIRGRKIGFVFQQFNLMPGFTALENVMLPMTFQDIPPEEREDRAKKLLKSVELSDRIHHKSTEMSGGEQQRVAIARSLANDPEVILADEPTGNLDSKTGKDIMKMLSDLHETEGRTIILVTHDEDVAKFADRIAHLRDGRIIDMEVKNEKNENR